VPLTQPVDAASRFVPKLLQEHTAPVQRGAFRRGGVFAGAPVAHCLQLRRRHSLLMFSDTVAPGEN